MPTYNFSFKITVGKRTPPKVNIYPTSVNEKIMKFPNGVEKSNHDIALELEHLIQKISNEINLPSNE